MPWLSRVESVYLNEILIDVERNELVSAESTYLYVKEVWLWTAVGWIYLSEYKFTDNAKRVFLFLSNILILLHDLQNYDQILKSRWNTNL